MHMIATVQEVHPDSLLVRSHTDMQDVSVNTNSTRCFRPGDVVSIVYNGVMTRSIPPQISAIRIRRIFPKCGCR